MTSRTAKTFAPPVMEAYSWLIDKNFSDIPLINVSQAAPVDPPPAPMLSHMAAVIQDDDTHFYGPVLGMPALRSEVSKQGVQPMLGLFCPHRLALLQVVTKHFLQL